MKKLDLTPEEWKARKLVQRSTPAAKAKTKAHNLAYNARPENKAWGAIQTAAYRAKPATQKRLKAYRLTPETKARQLSSFHAMPIELPNRPRPDWCECCGDFAVQTLSLDHDHSSGRFRGWCCHNCNTGLGLADNVERLHSRILYLRRSLQPEPIQWVEALKRPRSKSATVEPE